MKETHPIRVCFLILANLYKKRATLLLLHMSAMNSPLLNYRSFLYSIPLSHMQQQNYIYYLEWTSKILKIKGTWGIPDK